MTLRSMKKCIFRCANPSSLFGLPKNEGLRRLWLEFIYLVLPDQLNSANVFLCGNHFTEDCFTNRGQFELGYAKKLILIDSAVPTLRDNVTRVSNVTAHETKVIANLLFLMEF